MNTDADLIDILYNIYAFVFSTMFLMLFFGAYFNPTKSAVFIINFWGEANIEAVFAGIGMIIIIIGVTRFFK